METTTATTRVTPAAEKAMRRLLTAVDRAIAAARDAEKARDDLIPASIPKDEHDRSTDDSD